MIAAHELHGVTTEGVHLLTSVYRKPLKPANPSESVDNSMDLEMLSLHFTNVYHVRRNSGGNAPSIDNSPGSYKPLGSAYENTPSSMSSFSAGAGKGLYDTPSSMYSSSHSGTGYRLLTPHTPPKPFDDAHYPDPAYSTPTRRRTLADLADSTYITPTEFGVRAVQRQTAKYQTLNDHLLSTPGPKVPDDLFYYWNGGSPSTRKSVHSAPVSPEQQRRNTTMHAAGRLPSFNPLKHSQCLTLADWRKTTGQIKGQGSLKYVQEVPPDYRFTLENLQSGMCRQSS